MKTIQKHQNNGYRVIWWIYLEAFTLFAVFTITIKLGFIALVLALIATIYAYKITERNKRQIPHTLIITVGYLKISISILAEITGNTIVNTYSYLLGRFKQLWRLPRNVIKTQHI